MKHLLARTFVFSLAVAASLLAVSQSPRSFRNPQLEINMKRIKASLGFLLSIALVGAVPAHAQTLIGSEYMGDDIYEIDGATGVPTRIGGGTTSILPGLAYNPKTGTLFGTDEDKLYTVDLSNGNTTLVGAHGAQTVTSLTFDAAYTVMYAVGYDGKLYSISPATGTQTAIGALGYSPNRILALATNSAGTVYGTGTADELFTVNTATGAATLLGDITDMNGNVFGAGLTAIVFGDDDTLYGIETLQDKLVTLDVNTRVATPVGAAAIGSDIRGLAFISPDADGDGVPDASDAFPNDASETADTDGDGVGDNRDAYPNDPTRSLMSVPVMPALALLLLAGLLGLLGVRRLRL